MKELYHKIESHAHSLARCPVCGGACELWEHLSGDLTLKVVMCSRSDPFGPQEGDGIVDGGCPMYMPPNAFYQPTQREAVAYHKAYAKALVALREESAGGVVYAATVHATHTARGRVELRLVSGVVPAEIEAGLGVYLLAKGFAS